MDSAGKYYSTRNMRYFTLLKPDRIFVIHQKSRDISGRYNVKGETLMLSPDNEQISLIGHIQGRTVVDNEGERWIRPQYTFTNLAIRTGTSLEMQNRLPRGWLMRYWEDRYYICKAPKGEPPRSLDADAAVVIMRHGESDVMADATNMIAETPEYTIHLSMAPSGKLWPSATEDLLRIFLGKNVLEQTSK